MLFSFCAFCAFLWLYKVDAALIAFDDVLRAFDAHSWSKYRTEEIEFSRAEPLARVGSRTDRAVVLNQQVTSLTFFPDLAM